FFCLVLLAGYVGFYWGIWAAFLTMLEARYPAGKLKGILIVLGGAASWAALEYLRTYLFSGFPWTLLGDSQIHDLYLSQIASITGVYGISFILVLVNVAIAYGLELSQRRARRSYLFIGLTLVLVASIYPFGAARLHRLT